VKTTENSTQHMTENERYAKVDVIAPDGSIEDSVKVRFDRKQLIDIDPMDHVDLGVKKDEYRLMLKYIMIDGTRYLKDEEHDDW